VTAATTIGPSDVSVMRTEVMQAYERYLQGLPGRRHCYDRRPGPIDFIGDGAVMMLDE
jgi:hypothetical protein